MSLKLSSSDCKDRRPEDLQGDEWWMPPVISFLRFSKLRQWWESTRYADLSLDEKTLTRRLYETFRFLVKYDRNGQHVLVTYAMKPKEGNDFFATAAHFATEFSTGAFTKSMDAVVYYIDEENEVRKIILYDFIPYIID